MQSLYIYIQDELAKKNHFEIFNFYILFYFILVWLCTYVASEITIHTSKKKL